MGDLAFVPSGNFRRGGLAVGRAFQRLNGLAGGACQHHAFDQRVACQPVRTVQAGAGGFANGIQAAQVGAPGQVGQHAAAGVVSGRHDRNRLFADVDAEFGAALQDIGKVFLQKRRALVRDVEVDAVHAMLFHLEINRPGDHVARCQFGAFVMRRHEARATGRCRQQ